MHLSLIVRHLISFDLIFQLLSEILGFELSFGPDLNVHVFDGKTLGNFTKLNFIIPTLPYMKPLVH